MPMRWRHPTDLDEATQYFCEKIEEPGTSHLVWRLEKAKDIYKEFARKR